MPVSKPNPVADNFTGGKLTSDAGAILLQLADQKLRAQCATMGKFCLFSIFCLHSPKKVLQSHFAKFVGKLPQK